MLIHKMYECEYCGKEFDKDEFELCKEHEATCEYREDLNLCASCGNGKIAIHYEEEIVLCTKRKHLYDSCGEWKPKNK